MFPKFSTLSITVVKNLPSLRDFQFRILGSKGQFPRKLYGYNETWSVEHRMILIV